MKNFDDWWKVNKIDYESIGVNKLIAHKIWCDAVNIMSENTIKGLKIKYNL